MSKLGWLQSSREEGCIVSCSCECSLSRWVTRLSKSMESLRKASHILEQLSSFRPVEIKFFCFWGQELAWYLTTVSHVAHLEPEVAGVLERGQQQERKLWWKGREGLLASSEVNSRAIWNELHSRAIVILQNQCLRAWLFCWDGICEAVSTGNI